MAKLTLDQNDFELNHQTTKNKAEQLVKENAELKQMIVDMKEKISELQHIDEDIKDYITELCEAKNSLQDKQ